MIFFLFSGSGSKHSIAIFSTTPNRFWTRFDGFRWVLKSCVFEKIVLIFNIFFHFFAFKNIMKFDISLTYPYGNHSFSIQNIGFLLKVGQYSIILVIALQWKMYILVIMTLYVGTTPLPSYLIDVAPRRETNLSRLAGFPQIAIIREVKSLFKRRPVRIWTTISM